MRSLALGAVARRNPVTARRASVGAIAAGIAVFVVASTAPFAGADASHDNASHDSASHTVTHPQPRHIHYQPVGAASATTAVPGTSAPARRTVKSKVSLVAHTATTDPTVISGLAANGIPRVALNAYRVAAARMATVEPGCGIDWALLAGIGREESDHGQ